MKKVLFGLALIATIVVIGCKNENKSVEVALTEYQCPMKCEGDKTYTDKEVKCPVCNMSLVEIEHEDNHSDHKD